MKIVIIGGGAAGFFSALSAKKHNPNAEVLILERSSKLLSKVRISGGGRCNVTHACFDPKSLIQNYPRGSKELLGPFHQFGPQNTVDWFQERGVELKKEKDGRMFPTTDSSETIINCFLEEAKKLGVEIQTQTKLQEIKQTNKGYEIQTGSGSSFHADRVIFATGSAPSGWKFAKNLGHTLIPPAPSLFTFNVPTSTHKDLSGVSIPHAKVKIEGTKLEQEGPLLITHFGFSGPAVLKLSAFGARFLAEKNYEVSVLIDWVPEFSEEKIHETIEQERKTHPSKKLQNLQLFPLPKSLWKKLSEPYFQQALNSLSKSAVVKLCESLKRTCFEVQGKTTNKEEFVTCGGIKLSEVNFKTMESKLCKNLFFCGEILDIDGVTGGFKFQNAWTTGFLAGRAATS